MFKTTGLTPFILYGTLISASSVNAEARLDRIMLDQKIIVATDSNWPPQSYRDEKGVMHGFDVDVAAEIAQRLGVQIEFVTPSWGEIVSGNWNDKWDMHVGSMTPTKARALRLNFVGIYYYTPAVLASHELSVIFDIEDLIGATIGVQQGTSFENYLQQDLVMDVLDAPEYEYSFTPHAIKRYEGIEEALKALQDRETNEIDVVIDSMPTILQAMDSGLPIQFVGDPVFYEPLAIAIEYGDKDLAEKLGKIIEEMHLDGALSAISYKWYGVDYTTVMP